MIEIVYLGENEKQKVIPQEVQETIQGILSNERYLKTIEKWLKYKKLVNNSYRGDSMREKDQRKYITEDDILNKETRIDLIIDMLDLIDEDKFEPKKAVQYMSKLKVIEEGKLIRLLPNIIQKQII